MIRWIALLGPLACLSVLGYAHLALPAQTLVSDYALIDGGTPLIIGGTLALAAGCLSLAYGLTVREPSRSAAARVLLVAATGGLMLSALFPTDPSAGVSSLTGEIHRWSSAVVFTSLPVAGWSLARGRAALPRWNLVRSLSVTSALALGVYLGAHPGSVVSTMIGGSAYYGLLERGLLVAEIALIVSMGVAALRQGGVSAAVPAAPQGRLSAVRPDRHEHAA